MKNMYHELILHGGEKCRWKPQRDRVAAYPYQQFWETSCVELVDESEVSIVYLFNDKSPPSVHHFKFCPYCGREIDDSEGSND